MLSPKSACRISVRAVDKIGGEERFDGVHEILQHNWYALEQLSKVIKLDPMIAGREGGPSSDTQRFED